MRAKFLRVGPNVRGEPVIEVELETGELLMIVLDVAHARAFGSRLLECVDGRITARAPSRRVLELEIGSQSDTLPAPAEKTA